MFYTFQHLINLPWYLPGQITMADLVRLHDLAVFFLQFEECAILAVAQICWQLISHLMSFLFYLVFPCAILAHNIGLSMNTSLYTSNVVIHGGEYVPITRSGLLNYH